MGLEFVAVFAVADVLERFGHRGDFEGLAIEVTLAPGPGSATRIGLVGLEALDPYCLHCLASPFSRWNVNCRESYGDRAQTFEVIEITSWNDCNDSIKGIISQCLLG